MGSPFLLPVYCCAAVLFNTVAAPELAEHSIKKKSGIDQKSRKNR
jgi:hypothetical protein